MNNKGFTLIEIIAVIGLLALIATMVGTSLVSMNQKQNQKNYDTYMETIAEAGCIYFESKDSVIYSDYNGARAESNSYKVDRSYCLDEDHTCYVAVKTLINNGYISNDLIDPTTREPVTEGEVAVIRYIKGRKKCCYYPCN